ncbi:hypothetical protein [Ornithinimicrobium sufpigmenti]|uniref:hypothetical protein n=1 Tax=Ornithinimicrobium sufpigmenti TaxID=2508882 RepID=UPI001EDCCCD8|nr:MULTISPECIES: hypothetical protein [unclassified Ornithinimicrobium]
MRPDPAHRYLRPALAGLRSWGPRQVLVAVLAGAGLAVLLGLATVLIPNPVFGRDIPPVWWNYPVWLLTAGLSGMLVATYVRATAGRSGQPPEDQRQSRYGLAGGVLAWFAVGCPVCNKIALLALGYSGAITWFAPLQPFLGVLGLALITVALVWRLRGQVVCPQPSRVAAVAG